MLRRGWRWAVLLGVGMTLARSSAAEPSDEDPALLASLLRSGARAAKAKDWPGCIDAYTKAVGMKPDPITVGELGLCEEAAGRYTSAHPHLLRAVSGMAPGAPRRDTYQAALGRVVELVAIVIVTTMPTDARVIVDGRPVGRYDGRWVAVEPGTHVFAARLRGYEDAVKTLTVNAADYPNVELVLKEKPAAPPPPPVRPRVPSAPPPAAAAPAAVRAPFPCVSSWSARGALVPLACASGAMLLASAGTAIGFEVHATSKRSALVTQGFNEHACAPGQPGAGSADCKELAERGHQRTDARNVAIGAGVAAGVLAVSAGLSIALEPLGPRVKATAGANGGGIILEGTW